MRGKIIPGAFRALQTHSAAPRSAETSLRCCQRISSTTVRSATTLPVTGTGPPPAPPKPHASNYGSRVDERRRKADLLRQGQEIRASQSGKSSPLRRRFWKEVHVEETPEGYRILLDKRPVRLPSKTPVVIPLSKPHLAHAIAIEWDMLESAQQAMKNHKIPMTSIVSRAQDITNADAVGDASVRDAIITTMLRYLDTDTLLCWAPEANQDDDLERQDSRRQSLRSLQVDVAKPIMAYLTTNLWPGIDLKPALDEGSIMPSQQSEMTRSVISGWLSGLPAFELAALERAALASKSLLVATRLLVEWSEEFRDFQRDNEQRFGIEQAAEAANVEVKWQTGMWGEVEDTHDVNKEDMRLQLGSAILLVSGSR